MKKFIITIGSIFIISFLTGCSNNTSVCPVGKAPTKYVRDKIKSLNDSNVNDWMKEQYKLHQKLKVCNDEDN